MLSILFSFIVLFAHENSTWKKVPFEYPITSFKTHKGCWYLGTHRGLYRSCDEGANYELIGFENRAVGSIFIYKDEVFVHNYQGWLKKFEKDWKTVLPCSDSGKIFIHNGTLWVGCSGGSWSYIQDSSWKFHDHSYINSTLTLSKTETLVATTTGVFLLNNKNEFQFIESSPTYLTSFFRDSEGNIFASTYSNGTYLSTDLGKTWERYSQTLNLTFIQECDGEFKICRSVKTQALYIPSTKDRKLILDQTDMDLDASILQIARTKDGRLLIAGTSKGIQIEKPQVPVQFRIEGEGEIRLLIPTKGIRRKIISPKTFNCQDLNQEDSFSISAVPGPQEKFLKWEGIDCKDSDCKITLTTKPLKITAKFIKK